MARILTIDDEKLVCMLVEDAAAALGHQCCSAHSMQEGLQLAEQQGCDLVLLDILLPDGNGFSLLPQLCSLPQPPEVIVITSHTNPDDAETALRHGVANYLPKPLSVDKVARAVERSLAFRDAQKNGPTVAGFARAGVIGQSPAMRACLEQAARAAASEVNVLLYGETGAGKGLLARAVHATSGRNQGPLITVDCAALTESIVESELFGHLKGSFTGADRDRQGLIAQAHGGTLFLDEVGELPMTIQRAFLRVIEERRFRPVGARQEQESNFRLLAATNRNLDEMARLGLFRADLLYRLQGMSLTVPPLRERLPDIDLLLRYFLDDHCLRYNNCNLEVAEDCLETLRAYPWPGNVRELSHAVDRALAAAAGQTTLFAAHLPLELRVHVLRNAMEKGQTLSATPQHSTHDTSHDTSQATAKSTAEDATLKDLAWTKSAAWPSLKEHRDKAERDYLEGLLHHTRKDVRKAADVAGVSRGHLYELLKKHEINWRNAD